MKRIIYFFCLSIFSCNLSEKPANTANGGTTNIDSLQLKGKTWTAKSIEDLANYTWRPNHSDTSNYDCEVMFYDEYALYKFNGQCYYFFFTYTTLAKDYQQVQLEWTYKTDCMLDMSFLGKSNGIKRHPRRGDSFATYRLINDSTLSVAYNFPKWVHKVNEIAGDSLFPQRLYIKKDPWYAL